VQSGNFMVLSGSVLTLFIFQSEISDISPVPTDWLDEDSPKHIHTPRSEAANTKRRTRPKESNRVGQLLQQADSLLKEKQQKRSRHKTLDSGPSVADCMRSAPELLLTCGPAATDRWLDMIVDVELMEMTDESLVIAPPSVLLESYEFQLERKILDQVQN
jgi:hypothetical protein